MRIIVPFGEWEKNPRLQAKTSVGPQGRKRDCLYLTRRLGTVQPTLLDTRGLSWAAAKAGFIRLSEKAGKATSFRRLEPSLDPGKFLRRASASFIRARVTLSRKESMVCPSNLAGTLNETRLLINSNARPNGAAIDPGVKPVNVGPCRPSRLSTLS